MSEKEFAKALIDRIPEERLFYVIAYLQGAATPDEIPNDETLAAFKEIEDGLGHHFSGTTDELFAELLAE